MGALSVVLVALLVMTVSSIDCDSGTVCIEYWLY